jgi:HAD superfamily hydrolase (TIGR01509 family)
MSGIIRHRQGGIGKMQEHKIRAIIFDMDGVIIDSIPMHIKVWKDVLKKRGADFTERMIYEANGRSTEDVAKLCCMRFRLKEPAKKIVEEERALVQKRLGTVKLFSGVKSTLARLRKKYMLGLATSTNRKDTAFFKRKFSMEDCFGAFVNSEEVEHAKPSPEIFLLCAKKLGVKPSECVVVEDSIAGIVAAKDAGMGCIALATTFPREKLKKADIILNDINEINDKLIQKLDC